MERKIENTFGAWQEKQNQMYEKLISTVNSIKEQDIQINSAIEFISRQYEDIQKKIYSMEQEKKEDRKYVDMLEQIIEYLLLAMNYENL